MAVLRMYCALGSILHKESYFVLFCSVWNVSLQTTWKRSVLSCSCWSLLLLLLLMFGSKVWYNNILDLLNIVCLYIKLCMYRIKMSIHSLKVYLFTKMYFRIFIPLTSGLFLAMDDLIHSTHVLSIFTKNMVFKLTCSF